MYSSEDDDLAAGAVLFHAAVRCDDVVEIEHLTDARLSTTRFKFVNKDQ